MKIRVIAAVENNFFKKKISWKKIVTLKRHVCACI